MARSPLVVALVVLLALAAGPPAGLRAQEAAGPRATGSGDAAPTPLDGDERFFAEPSEVQRRAEELFRGGVAAWREGRHERAEELWLETLRVIGPPTEPTSGDQLVFDRHALLYDLGNAAFRGDRPLEAVAWYRAALRHRPRHDATHDNLALARERAGLPPASDGSAGELVAALLDAWTPGEARWLALVGLVPLALALAVEALRGGRAAALWALLALVTAATLAAPYARQRLAADERPLAVVAPDGARVRSEARAAAPVVAVAPPGATVEFVDELPLWVRVRLEDGADGWVEREAVFELLR